MKRWLLALAAFLLTLAVLWEPVHSMPQDGDETQYGWTAVYHGSRLVRLDFKPEGTHLFTDPEWSPYSYWTLTQPMTPRLLLAIPIALTGSPVPALPFSWSMPALQGPEQMLEYHTLLAMRFGAATCAALGLAAITWRLGLAGFLAVLLFLAIPHVRTDLHRATGEGPLLLSFGLAVLSYGSRWFAPICALAATMKLTAVGLWPLAVWHGFGRGKYRRVFALLMLPAFWSLLTPPSWFAGGPLFLAVMWLQRATEHANQAALPSSLIPGFFFPTRYLWPFELAACLAVPVLLRRHRARLLPPARELFRRVREA